MDIKSENGLRDPVGKNEKRRGRDLNLIPILLLTRHIRIILIYTGNQGETIHVRLLP